ncbi:MAG: hypothetical protein VYD19_05430, partial [Myxococcota bacterium]|nr:hypothetical protein [Myxococcota bacterium]
RVCGEWPIAETTCADWWAEAAPGEEGASSGATQACYDYHQAVAAMMEGDDRLAHCAHSIGQEDAAGNAPCTDPAPEEKANGIGCGVGEACILVDGVDGAALASCTDAPSGNTGGPGVNGDSCVDDDNTYWGTEDGGCNTSNLCIELTEGEFSCTSFCDRDHLDICGDYQACAMLLRIEDVGLCFGQCEPFLGAGCDEGESCVFSNVGMTEERQETAFGFCFENSNQGEVATGEPCTPAEAEDDPTSDCAPGHICGAVEQGAPPICIKLCQEDGPEGSDCGEDSQCRTGVFDGLNTIGICTL